MLNRHLMAFLSWCVVATSGAAIATPLTLLTTMPVPSDAANVQPGGAFTSFDISFVDPSTGFYYVADRSNAAVDIYSGSALTFLGRATGFAGQQATTSISGPDGVVVNPATHTLFAGDGPSVLRTFNVAIPAAPTPLFAPINTGGSFRVDEMAFAPGPNLVLAANNADNPAFATLVNASTGAIVAGHITIPGQVAGGGMEQPVWDPNTGTFFVSIPTFSGSDSGGVAEISTAGAVLRTIHFDALGISSCSPTGLALGGSGNLMVGCGNAGTQTVVLNPAGAGSIAAVIAQISGSDELYYDPATAAFYVTGLAASGDRVFDVINDATFGVLQSVSLTALGADHVNAHSIAVDPLNGRVFVPLEGTVGNAVDTLCPIGCVAVFANAGASVPEPGSLPLMLIGVMGVLAIAGGRRLRSTWTC